MWIITARWWCLTIPSLLCSSRDVLHVFWAFSLSFLRALVAPYCAIPRDYLSDTPLLRAMGFLVSQHGQLGAIPPPPFLSVSPLESMRSGGEIPPPQKGYLSDTWAIPFENKANGCDTPLCDTTVELLCLQSIEVPFWTHFPTVSKKASAVSQKAKAVIRKAKAVSKKAPRHNCKQKAQL